MKGKVIFNEVQSFRYTWSWGLMLAISISLFILFGTGMYQQLALGEPWGDNPMGDTLLVLVSLVSWIITVGILIFLPLHHLQLQIDEGSIRYKFYPYFSEFRAKYKSAIKEVKVRKYKPIEEFGGWGNRRRFKGGRAYNIKGDWGYKSFSMMVRSC